MWLQEILKKTPKAAKRTNYELLWVDPYINSIENKVYCKAFKSLGFINFKTFEDDKVFNGYLISKLKTSQNHIFILCGGRLSKGIVDIITSNAKNGSIAKMIIFTMSIDMNKPLKT